MPTGHFDVHTPVFGSIVFPRVTVTTIATAAAVTYTVAQILGGVILRDTNGAARSDTLPTAAALAAAIQGIQVGTAFEFALRNSSAAANSVTVVAGAGLTISGTATVAQLNSKAFLVVFTNVTPGSEAATVYSEGTSIF